MASFAEWTEQQKKKKKKEELTAAEQAAAGKSFTEYTKQVLGRDDIEAPLSERKKDDDIAPVVTTTEKEDEKGDGDFWDWLGNSAMSGLATFNKGITATADLILGKPLQALGWEDNPISSIADYYSDSYDHYKGKANEEADKLGGVKNIGASIDGVGLGNEYDIAGSLIEGTVAAVPMAIEALMTSGLSIGKSLLGSAGGATSNLATQAAYQSGNLLTRAGLTLEGMAKNPQFWTSFAQTYGTDYEEAKKQLESKEAGKAAKAAFLGEEYEQENNDTKIELIATLGATITSLLNAGVEIGITGGSGIQGLPDKVANGGKSAIFEWVKSSLEEGGEEVVQGVISRGVNKAMYGSDEKVLDGVEMLKEGAMGTIVGGVLGGGQIGVQGTTNAIKQAQANQLTENEQKVVDKVVENRIAEEELAGKPVTATERKAIEKQVKDELFKGGISIDTIEEVLGGDTYKAYKNTIDSEMSLQKEYDTAKAEYDTLNGMKRGEMTGVQQDRQAELKAQMDELKAQIENKDTIASRDQLKAQLGDEVFNLSKDSRLVESYNERARRGVAYEAELSKYDTKQQKVIQKAVDSGILNNTRRTHEFVDMIARISADKGVLFDFANNEKLKEYGYTVEGATVNGVKTDDGSIVLNIDAAKSLNSVTGHEITHILEGTELYDKLQEAAFAYAEIKGEYDNRLDALTKLYRGKKGYETDFDKKVLKELTADLVGDYLFTDEAFIKKLSVEHRNVFQKIYDEVKYLLKVATAGSAEARELEKVKHAFDKAYKESGKAKGDTKYSLAMVEEVQPKSNKWRRTLTTEEAKTRFPKLWDVAAEESEVRNPTQISSTVKSYRKVYDYLKGEGFNGTILDASSGLGYGTKAGIEEYGFNVEDIEPYPDKSYSPKYKDYSTLDKKYDVVISNAVLNVLPQDQRDALVVKMGEMLNDGGRIFINVRGKDVDTLAANKNNTNISPMEWFVDSTGSYQKGFTKGELVAYLQDALGDGFTVKPTSMFGAVSAIVTKDGGVKYSLTEYTDAEKKAHNDAVKEHFGKTYSWNETGYLLLDGTKLDLSGKHDGAPGGYRTVDHRDIVNALGDDYGDGSYSGSLVQFMSEGNIRIIPEMGGINLSVKPTEAQEKALAEYVMKHRGEVVLDIDDTNGYTVASVEYPVGTRSSKVLSDIRAYFENGTKPENTTLYSLSHNKEIAKGQNDYVVNHKSSVTAEELAEAQKVTAAMVDVMMKYSSILPEDKIGKVLTKNGSYDRSVENTTICVRTLAYNEFVDKVQEEIGRPLTQMESFLVSQKMYDIATDPQCLYCYVSLDRKAFNDMLLRYMQDRDTVIAKYNNSDKTDAAIESLYEEFLHGRKPTTEMRKRFDSWISYVDNGTQLLSLADIATEARQADIAGEEGGVLAEQLKDARKYAQSASWSKIQKDYVAYRDEILKLGDKVVKNLNEHYGMRWYSFSDYSAAFIVENMQQITDASIRGLKGLSYTKDTDYAEIFAPSGMNINISVFVNTDADGNFFIDEKQSANLEKALALREQYPNVGIVATVTNDEALRWAGEQEWTDVIIPFHIVRTGTDVAEYYKWLNYTAESADTVGNKDLWEAYLDSLNLKSDSARKKVSKNIYPSEHKNDKATYLNLCESRGLSPRFARFAGEDWYMKLVNETRLSADDSSVLKPSYNLDAAKASFQKFVDKGGYEGGWYKEGVDVDAEAKIVAGDVLAGKKANEVAYGRQDGFVPEDLIAGRKANRKHGQLSLSPEGETAPTYGNYNVHGKDIALETAQEVAPVQETATEDVAPVQVTAPRDEADELISAIMDEEFRLQGYDKNAEPDYAPTTEEEANALAEKNLRRITDADMPPEAEAPYQGESKPMTADDPFAARNWHERGTKAFITENPDAKRFFQEEAQRLADDYAYTMPAERGFSDEQYYNTNGEKGFYGWSRKAADDINTLIDVYGLSYAQITEGLDAIINDTDKVNNKPAKTIEFILNDRMLKGYETYYSHEYVAPNQGYIEWLNGQRQAEEYAEIASTITDADAPMVDDVAPVMGTAPSSALYNKRDGENGWGDVYATAQEALNDAVQSVNSELWNAFIAEFDNTPSDKPLPRGSTPITDALIAVQEDVRQETITPIQGARLISEAYNSGGVDALRGLYNPKTGNLFDKHLERAKRISNAPIAENIAPVKKSGTSPLMEIANNGRRDNLKGAYTQDGKQYIADGSFIAEFNEVDKSLATAKDFPAKKVLAELNEAEARQTEGNYSIDGDAVAALNNGTRNFIKVGDSLFDAKYVDAIISAIDSPVFTMSNVHGGDNALFVVGSNGRAVLMPVRAGDNVSVSYEAQPITAAPVADTLTVEDVMPIADAPVAEKYEAIKPQPKAKEPRMVRADNAQPRMVRADNSNAKPNEKQRKWVGTSTESEAVNREILPDDLDQKAIHYQPIPNKVTLGKANAKLDGMGYDKAVNYFNSKLADKNTPSLEDIALGERLLQEAIKKGDTKTAGELIQDIAILGTELGQKVQALSIIKRLTPEGQLKMLQKVIERGKTKGDKAYEGVELTQDMIGKILKAYNKDGSFDQAKLNKAVEDVKQDIANKMKVTKLDKINAWRYLSMLGNPKTHIRNLVSNVAMRGTVAVKNVIARSIEGIAPIENRTKTWKRATDDVKAFAAKTTAEMQDILRDGGKYSEDASIKEKRKIFKSKILNGLYEFNSDMLSREDWWFSKPAFTNALAECLTANGIRTEEDILLNPEIVEKARQYATEQSQIATFRQYSWLSNKINEIERKNAATSIAVGAVLPFKKTPINIAKTGLNYSPLGFAKTLTYDIAQVKNGKMEASELVDHLAQNITGTGLALVGFMLAQSGLLSGGGEDDKEGEYDYQLGEQAYAVNIGGKSYSLSWLSPVAMPLFVGANAYEQLVEGKEWNGDVVVETLAQTLDPLSEMSFVSGLDSVLSSYDSGIEKFAGIGQSMAQNYITQFVPTLSSQVATVIDDTKRSTKVAGDSGFKFVDETINKLKLKIPVLRQTLEPSTDIWGNEVKQTEDVITRAVETFIAPYSKREDITTEIDEEIKALYSATGDDGLIPSIPYNYVNYKDEKYKMSAEEYTAYKKTYGQTAFDMLGELYDTSTYRSATDEEKADMVNRVYDYARDAAKREYLAKEGVTYTNATEDNVDVFKENPIKGAIENDMSVDEYVFYSKYPDKYAVAKAVGGYDAYKGYSSELYDIKADKDEDGKSISGSRKEKVIEYINNLDADYGERIILFKSEYNADDTYNYDIIEYLNSRDDISYDEMVAILKELGFTVTADGSIYW